uniref:Reverse transcriptase domain-containing protein n=1 Tax=Strongyloides venezuelensis TaxID=75913 RepID=A0A0K0FZ82_STRVS
MKSLGPDSIQTWFIKIFKFAESEYFRWMKLIFERKLMLSKFVLEAYIILLYKGASNEKNEKENRMNIKNYRPISLINSDIKLLSKILSTKVLDILKEQKIPIIPIEQQGGVKGLDGTTISQIIHNGFKDIVENPAKAKLDQRVKGMYYSSTDIRKAFDTVDHKAYKKIIESLPINKNLKELMVETTINRSMRIKLRSDEGKEILSDKIPLRRGIAQGDSASVLKFQLVMAPLSHSMNKMGPKATSLLPVSHTLFIDDLIFYGKSPNDLLILEEIAKKTIAEMGFELNISKCHTKLNPGEGSEFENKELF